MVVELWFHPAIAVLYSCWHGSVTLRGVRQVQAAMSGDPRFDPSNKHLVDLRDVTSTTVGGDEAFSIGQYVVHGGDGQRAIVATLPEVLGAARMVDSWSQESRPNSETFASFEQACRWLGIPDGYSLCQGTPVIVEAACQS